MAFSSSREHRVLDRILQWLAIGDFHNIMNSSEKYGCFMPAAFVDSSLQLSISSETIHKASNFKPLSKFKT
jgi:hypothetical protein